MILPKLEKMGLISKTLERPIFIKAVPPDKALNYLINAEQNKANEKIKQLTETVNWLSEALKSLEQNRQQVLDCLDTTVVFFSADMAINHRIDEAYASAKKHYCLVINFDLLRRRATLIEGRLRILANNGVKTRILIDNINRISDAQKILEDVVPQHGDFSIKQSGKVTIKPYILVDDREVLIATQQSSPGGYPCCLCTNARNIIAIYRDNFEKAWEKSYPIFFTPKTNRATLKLTPSLPVLTHK
jgi:sugar-specific transcriptional regulator TrmB